MREVNYGEAIREGLREEMRRDEDVILLGVDVGSFEGINRMTTGFSEEFGSERVINTPISEGIITGASVGAAMMGLRPVAEIYNVQHFSAAVEGMATLGGRVHYASAGNASVPMVLRAPFRNGGDGNDSYESWFAHIPGVKVVMPTTPHDAKGLIKSSIRDNNPVLFLEHALLHPPFYLDELFYEHKGPVPEEEYTIPLGVADVKREGSDVTIVATGMMVHYALAAAEALAGDSISPEVIDPRTIKPLDKKTILDSVKKTGRLVIAHEAWKTLGIGAEIAAIVAEDQEALSALKAPVVRVANPDVHIPFSPDKWKFVLPNEKDIVNAVKEVTSKG